MNVYVVVRGGVVQYVTSDTPKIGCVVIDLDDLRDLDKGEPDRVEMEKRLARADKEERIW